jgi:hypothetical protein
MSGESALPRWGQDLVGPSPLEPKAGGHAHPPYLERTRRPALVECEVMPEDRKPIAGDEGFSDVSTHGRVRSYHQTKVG